MDASSSRKRRLERLLGLAQAYRGWSRKELARALGRDPTKLVPGTGVPKLDLVVELARVLDWPVGDVVEYWESVTEPTNGETKTFETLDRAALQAHRGGQHRLMAELARKAYAAATTGQERAIACNRESGAWDGLGRYQEALEAVTRGLQETGVTWALVEARSISQDLIDRYEIEPPACKNDRMTHAFSHYVSGHTYRRLIGVEPDRARAFAERARRDLEIGLERYRALATELDDESFLGIANTCRGGIIEVDVELGRLRPIKALEELAAGLDAVSEADHALFGDRLESYGWWCIFGCNIALRHLTDERTLQQYMAVFTNKADEIANSTDNWAMRERVFTMQYTRWERASGITGFDIPHVIDLDDVRVITGTMGRFPTFRETGWRILQSAQVVDGN
jgi:hypothetical protein